jgi:hypothetical protein
MIDATIIALLVLNLLFSVWMLRVISIEISKAVAQLDTMLAQTIQSLIEKGIGDFEPVNPIQEIIASMMKKNLTQNQPSADVIDVVRDAGGKFS